MLAGGKPSDFTTHIPLNYEQTSDPPKLFGFFRRSHSNFLDCGMCFENGRPARRTCFAREETVAKREAEHWDGRHGRTGRVELEPGCKSEHRRPLRYRRQVPGRGRAKVSRSKEVQ